MDGVAFEQYLARVFRALGYSVQTTPASGDHGVDLVVQKGAVRIAVQAKCYQGNVDNSAVQQAVAGMKMYGCNACSAITNSRFTGGAVTLAQANNCILVDANNFDRFVTGEFDLALTVAATTAALR